MKRGGPGGKREGAGRKKGIPNKANLKRQEEIAATGITPLEVLIDGMRFHHGIAQAALAANPPDAKTANEAMKEAREFAKDAAPYVHPKLAAVEHKGKDGGPIQVSITGTDAGLL